MSDDALLFHYTSSQGLLGLLGSPAVRATLWMTQIQYMNDRAEARHTYELTANELRRLEARCSNLKRAAAGFLGIPHEGQRWEEPQGFAVVRDYIFSLSEEADLLSQWRGYAPLGGYSVGYRVKDLQTFATAQGLRLERCVYDENEQQEYVRTSLLEMESGFIRGEVEGELPGVPEHDRARATASMRFQQLGHRLAPIYKHPSFREEREWRLIGNIGVNDPRARWRTRGNLVVPYAELEVGLGAISPLIPVKIIVGPSIDYELAAHSIGYMTFNHPLKPQVTQSKSTLRP